MPYMAFVAFLGILYIANSHYAERNLRKIQILEKEYEEQQYRTRSMESVLMYKSTPVQVAKAVAGTGISSVNAGSQVIVKPGKRAHHE